LLSLPFGEAYNPEVCAAKELNLETQFYRILPSVRHKLRETFIYLCLGGNIFIPLWLQVSKVSQRLLNKHSHKKKINMKKMRLLAALFCLAFNFLQAQSSRFERENFTNDKGDTLRYRLLTPDYALRQKYPLVIFLHGSGERGSDNEKQLQWGVQNFATDQMMVAHPAYVLAPQCPDKQGWSNLDRKKGSREMKLLPQPSKPLELLIALIKELIQKNPIDTTRIYITGLSMGGYGTFDALERYPQLFAAAVPVCGAGDTSRVATIAQVPIWIFHGADDAAVDPLCSIDMHTALLKAGAHPGLTIYPNVGHFSWLGAYSDPAMMEWLFRQHK
jgi:predicted peptidase